MDEKKAVSRIYPLIGLVFAIIGLIFTILSTTDFYSKYLLNVSEVDCRIGGDNEKLNCDEALESDYSVMENAIPGLSKYLGLSKLMSINYEAVSDILNNADISIEDQRVKQGARSNLIFQYKETSAALNPAESPETEGGDPASPISYIGIISYIVFILFFIWGIISIDKYRNATLLGPFIISIISLIVSIKMLVFSVNDLGSICPKCLVMYIMNVLIFLLMAFVMVVATRRSGKEPWISAFTGPFFYKDKSSWQILITQVLILVFSFTLAYPMHKVIYLSYTDDIIDNFIATISDSENIAAASNGNNVNVSHESSNNSENSQVDNPLPESNRPQIDYSKYDIEVPLTTDEGRPINPVEISHEPYELYISGAPSVGTNEYDIEIVIFSDFECPYCAYLGDDVHKILEHFENKIIIYYKYFPLDRRCNARLQQRGTDFHFGACFYSYGAYAASQQDKFWEFHDLAYDQAHDETQEMMEWYQADPENRNPYQYFGYVEHVMDMASSIGCEMEKFNEDFNSANAMRAIALDLEQGFEMQITSTPTVFVNGYRIVTGSKNFYTITSLIVKMLTNSPLPFASEDEDEEAEE